MNFGVLVFDEVEELDFIGPWEMLTMWQKVADGPENCVVVAEQKRAICCAKGLSVNPHVDFDDCPPLTFYFGAAAVHLGPQQQTALSRSTTTTTKP